MYGVGPETLRKTNLSEVSARGRSEILRETNLSDPSDTIRFLFNDIGLLLLKLPEVSRTRGRDPDSDSTPSEHVVSVFTPCLRETQRRPTSIVLSEPPPVPKYFFRSNLYLVSYGPSLLL